MAGTISGGGLRRESESPKQANIRNEGGKMRELRFRVWSDYWGKYATEAELCMDGSADAVFEDDDGVTHHENTGLVVEFDTGLKDKNGKLIYEGDIVSEEIDTGMTGVDGKYIYVVKWSEDFCSFIAQTIKTPTGAFIHDELYQLNMSREVIGNIHENQELLKGEG